MCGEFGSGKFGLCLWDVKEWGILVVHCGIVIVQVFSHFFVTVASVSEFQCAMTVSFLIVKNCFYFDFV